MNRSGHKILVWDAPTRLFHWLTVVLVMAAYATWQVNWMDWHAWTGDAVLALVLFRLLWGFFGSETARFSAFVSSPGSVVAYIAAFLRRDGDCQVGHNPAGGWMVLLLLALLVAEALTGLFVNNDVANEGPLTELVPTTIVNLITDLHLYFWDALFAAVILHVLAILFYASAKQHDLVTPMITGFKTLPEDIKKPQLVGAARAAFLFGCSTLATVALAHFF